MSSPHIRLDERGAVRHVPKELVRQVVLYDDKVEFDFSYRTNNLGFVDHRDYGRGPPGRRSYAFVGDSFVKGMGAEPWVPQLRDTLRKSGHEIEIYNLGVNGASILHSRKLLASVSAELPITEIVLLPITHDFYRRWWVPVQVGDKILACRDPASCDPNRFGAVHAAYIIDREATISSLVARKNEALLVQTQSPPQPEPAVYRPPLQPIWRRALQHSELYVLARPRVKRLLERFELRAPEPGPYDETELLGDNLSALAGIRADFPTTPITLVHFPEKDEVEYGRYRLNLRDHAERLGIQYLPALRQCKWSLDMYHPNDSHPNAKGYSNMQTCLTKHLLAEQMSILDGE